MQLQDFMNAITDHLKDGLMPHEDVIISSYEGDFNTGVEAVEVRDGHLILRMFE